MSTIKILGALSPQDFRTLAKQVPQLKKWVFDLYPLNLLPLPL